MATPSAPPTSRLVSLTAEPDPGLVQRERAHDRLGRRRDRQAHARAHQDHRDHHPRVARRHRRRRRHHEAGGEQQHPGDDDALRAEPLHGLRRQRRHDHQRERERQRAHTGVERGVAEHELQVLRGQEDEAEQGEEHEGHVDARGAEAGVGEEADVEHRLVDAPLPPARRSTSATTATAKPARISGSVQPLLGASMMAATSAPSPTIDNRGAHEVELRAAPGSATSAPGSGRRRSRRSRSARSR